MTNQRSDLTLYDDRWGFHSSLEKGEKREENEKKYHKPQDPLGTFALNPATKCHAEKNKAFRGGAE